MEKKKSSRGRRITIAEELRGVKRERQRIIGPLAILGDRRWKKRSGHLDQTHCCTCWKGGEKDIKNILNVEGDSVAYESRPKREVPLLI